MFKSPSAVLERITSTIRAWQDVCPTQTFSGLTLEQFREIVKASLDARAELAENDNRRQAIVARRDACDIVSNEAVLRVVHGVKGEPTQGEDGAMYAAMGFTRKSLRSSGLTRRRVKGKEDQT